MGCCRVTACVLHLLWHAVWWKRRLTSLMVMSQEDCRIERIQLSRLRGVVGWNVLLNHPISYTFLPCAGCSELEQKIDLLTKMTDELARQQQVIEDATLQHKRYFLIAWHTCIWQCYYLYRSLPVLGVQVDGTENWPTNWNDCWVHQKISELGETLALQDGGTIMAMIQTDGQILCLRTLLYCHYAY